MGKVLTLAENIYNNIKLLEKNIENYSIERVVEEEFLFNAVLHILQISIQSLIDLASHVIAESGLGAVSTYAEIPIVLEKHGIISKDESNIFRKIIGFRNVIVHLYLEVSKKLVKSLLKEKKYLDILKISQEIVEWALRNKVDP